MDYEALSTIIFFGACATLSCASVTIVDDRVYEPEQFFGVTLERTPGLDSRITLDPVDGQIVINSDNNGKSNLHYIYE